MHYIIVTQGTDGDVHPFVGIGIELVKRGHKVTLMTIELFAHYAERHGFDFVPVGSTEEFREQLKDPDIWKILPNAKSLGRWMLKSMPDHYQAIIDRYVPGQTAIVASGAAIGARIAHETHQIPLTMIVLQPAILRSAYAPPLVAGLPNMPGWVPASMIRAGIRILDVVLDRIFFVDQVNDFRAGFGLAPIKRIADEWMFSPQRVIAMFPEWYAPKQADWPSQLVHTGFPLFDGRRDDETLPTEVETFLRVGDAPIAFTPGSGMMHAHRFFEQATEACKRLGKRGALLTRFADQVPKKLPPEVRHFDYVPFGSLLPRCAALVHHGGIGTMSQALTAGIPQLVMPLAGDQPDNAARLKRMGVADAVLPKHFLAPAVAKKLSKLLDCAQVSQRCRHFSQLLQNEKPMEATCDLIEAVGR